MHPMCLTVFKFLACYLRIHLIICAQENHVVDGNMKWMQQEEEERTQLVIDGKVDWKGRKALKHKHGGMRVSLLVLGKLGLTK